MSLPTEFKINSVPYKFDYMDEKEAVDGNITKYGKVVHQESIIKIFKGNQVEEAIWSSIWHEVVHVFLSTMDFGMNQSQEELLVETIARGINSVILDNNLFKE